jgi:NADH-quinone oxidoreductase subunit J
MSGLEIIFLIFALITLFAGLKVVTTSNLIHAALWLIVALFGIAVFFVLLNATFLAVVQVMVYIGAIAILMIFTVMLTRRVMQDTGPQINNNWQWAVVLSVILFAGLTLLLVNSGISITSLPDLPENVDTVSALGQALVSPSAYVIPFELASVLLLAALIGAIVVAWKE